MSSSKLVVTVMGIAILPLVAIAVYSGLPHARSLLVGQTVAEAATVESSRDELLQKLTKSFAASSKDPLPTGIATGEVLAPVHYLNGELERRGVKWRVRSIDGLTAETHDVS